MMTVMMMMTMMAVMMDTQSSARLPPDDYAEHDDDNDDDNGDEDDEDNDDDDMWDTQRVLICPRACPTVPHCPFIAQAISSYQAILHFLASKCKCICINV